MSIVIMSGSAAPASVFDVAQARMRPVGEQTEEVPQVGFEVSVAV